MGITVKELICKAFRIRKLVKKIQIVSEGKPRPLLNMSTVTLGVNGNMKTETFDPAMYDQIQWLTGCETEQSFHCWPCLLFSLKNKLWKVTEIAFLLDAISEHEKDVEHIQAALTLKKFSSEYVKMNVDNDQCKQISHKSRKLMKLLIDAVCSIVSANLPFPVKNSCQNQIKPEMCVNALNLLKFCNNYKFKYFEHAIELIKTSPTLLDDLVDSVTKVVKLAVSKEAQMSTYVALIISDHSTNPEKSQFSVVLRYIEKGKVCERFLGFVNIFVFRSVHVINEIIESIIATFGIAAKFLAYSFDGAVMEMCELIELNSLLQNTYPQSYFVPCYFQGTHHVIQQSLSVHKELTQFFKILDVMEDYFQKASQQRKVFEYFMFSDISSENSKWYFNAPFIKIVCRCRNRFIQALKSIIKNCTDWSADDNTKAHGLIRFLEEFHTVCLLHILSPLYERILRFDEAVRSNSPGLENRCDLVNAIMLDLLYEKNHFEKYFNGAINEMNSTNNDEQESKRLNRNYEDLKGPFESLFITIIEHLEKEIEFRFSKLDDLSFCSLADIHSVNIPKEKLDYCYWKLNKAPRHNFSSQLFDSEIIVQRTNGVSGNKTAYDLLNSFENSNLKTVFKCTNRLLEFTLTMPFRPPVQDGDSSIFKKINRLSYPITGSTTVGDASVLCVESEFLRELRSDVFFYDEVIQEFHEIKK